MRVTKKDSDLNKLLKDNSNNLETLNTSGATRTTVLVQTFVLPLRTRDNVEVATLSPQPQLLRLPSQSNTILLQYHCQLNRLSPAHQLMVTTVATVDTQQMSTTTFLKMLNKLRLITPIMLQHTTIPQMELVQQTLQRVLLKQLPQAT